MGKISLIRRIINLEPFIFIGFSNRPLKKGFIFGKYELKNSEAKHD